ncbi:hypothetical protein [Rhizorhapis sp. SPR117]|uniref:hypothetical protein n=1 Tax=Rhizorhapis sp. SPR117 TaxID=2912611 RepID=UPI001F3D1BC6|nr:hypothetical protein [Rhizorhapis sp. SPR117]
MPIGIHGRPDINPYERDIDMTVPLNFQNRTLGEIPMRLTADDRFLLETATFLRLMRPILNDQAHAALAAQLQSLPNFSADDLGTNGVQLTYDPSTLAVVLVDVGAEQRAVQNLFAAPRDDVNDVTLKPAGFSAYLNLNLNQTYIWEQNQADPPTINFDGAFRFGQLVFEGDAQLGQRFGGDGDAYKFSRNYARLVYDQADDYRRWMIGDLDPETRGQQSYVQMGGIGVLRQQRRFNAFRSAILQSNRQLIVQRESTVRFLRNGALYREIRLQPGRYDFSSLPLVAGSNDVDIEIRDNSGSVQSLSYQQYLDPIDLDPGDYEFGAYLGMTNRSFGSAPDYKGPAAFTGFFRKAFVDSPAIGIGLQASKEVQTLSGQTQFILPNGGRILLDGAASNSKDAGQGFASGVSYEHFIDRGGLSDNFSLRADYISPDYATLGNPEAFNSTSFNLSGQYTRQFSFRVLGTATASYLKGRGNVGDSYRLGVTGHYRLTPKWTFRAGVDYAKFPSAFASGNGISFNIGLVFQPDYRRRAEARFESRDRLAELSYNQSGLNQLDSLGFGGVLARQDDNARAQGFATYSANRFEAAMSHGTFGPSLSDLGSVNATSVRVGTTLAFADGMFGVGRRINDSFMLLSPHKNLGDRSVVAGQSIAENNYIGRSGTLGAAVNNFLGSYVTQSVQYDVEDPPTGYDIGPGVVRVHPPYKSGYALRIGTDAFVSAVGTLVLAADRPVSLIGGRVTLLDVREGENLQPIPFFTNSVGRFSISNLLPGRRYLVETYSTNGTVDRGFEFAVPADTDGLAKLGIVQSGTKN